MAGLASAVVFLAGWGEGTSDFVVDEATSSAAVPADEDSSAGDEPEEGATETDTTVTGESTQVRAVTVPLDHDDPHGPQIEIPIYTHGATDPGRRIGVLFVNPGGPGVPGLWMAANAAFLFTEELTAHFDIVAFDPRGTFEDTAVSCLGYEEWVVFESSIDWSPDSPGEREALDAHVDAAVDTCVDDSGEMIRHVSTMDTVHDMALIAEALGVSEVSYVGQSYGGLLRRRCRRG